MNKNLLLIFTYAPAGLGHLRVTDALYNGLPKEAKPVILGSHDRTITFLHKIASTSIFGRRLMEYFQYGALEEWFTVFYRKLLRLRSKRIYEQLLTLIEQNIHPPSQILIVSTHFALAHQIAQIKDKLAKEKNIPIFLAVQVTDDSPQKIWFVPGADILFVPSLYTKNELQKYGRKFKKIEIEIIPYPLSPALAKLNNEFYQKRIQVLAPHAKSTINIAIPISGAAVQLSFYEKIIRRLRLLQRFHFYVVSKEAVFTKQFLAKLKNRNNIVIASSTDDRKVVDAYEEVYCRNPIDLEITKPSEQAFKALLPFDRVGGSILLFTKPVGRQEQDNLNFLIHHRLIPNEEENEILVSELQKEEKEIEKEKVLTIVRGCRGFLLPLGSLKCFNCIVNALHIGLFYEMLICGKRRLPKPPKDQELGIDGVEKFWEKVEEQIANGK